MVQQRTCELHQELTRRIQAEKKARELNETLEVRVIRRTEQLREINRELETLVHAVCHDVAAPLRAVAGFSDALLEDCDELGETARDYARRIQQASHRTQEFIEDLREIFRVSRMDLDFSAVNLSNVAKSVADDLRAREPDRCLDIEIEPDMVVWANGNLSRIVVQHLLTNAWKFTRDLPQARIHFGSAPDNHKTTGPRVLCLRDNGPGFPEEAQHDIFAPFTRLHPTIEGTGMGLTIAQRCVLLQGGRIWAESRPDEGACFYLSLDVPPEHAGAFSSQPDRTSRNT